MTIVQRAREYERKYHEELYGRHDLFEPGSWLHKPAAYAVKAFDLVPKRKGIRVLDLGGGVGRHSIPAAKYFGADSRVECIDLLASAIDMLQFNAKKAGVGPNVVGSIGDVEGYDLLGKSYDLVLSISCIEHVPTKERLDQLIQQLQTVTKSGGVHCFMMITDNKWIDSGSNEDLVPLVEQNLTSGETNAVLQRLYGSWRIADISTKNWEAAQAMEGKDVVLKSTCVQFTAQKLS